MSEKPPHGPLERRVEQAVERGRRFVVLAVLVMMTLTVLVAAVDVAWEFVRRLAHPLAFAPDGVLEIFGLLLLVLVGVELLETVHGALDRPPVVQAQTVLLAALVAAARSVILTKSGAGPEKLIASAALLVALAAAVMLLGRRAPRA